ncbi:hypothetical protein LCGC14_2589870 [marine sediment metagenome]|uniref:Uncharacterized protein n=1 Tax=marine sediment metagenome TaxID=412755 RepID=A0A0F9CN09_9ZZZZ
MKTTETWRRDLRYRAGRPHDEFSRVHPFQLRLSPGDVLALLDDIDELLNEVQPSTGKTPA